MTEINQDFSHDDPAENLGFVRLNWRVPAPSTSPLIVMVPYESDSAFDLVQGLVSLEFSVEVWRLDPRSTRARRNRRAEIGRMQRASRSPEVGQWAGVMPFDRDVAKSIAGSFPDARIMLITDDLAVLSVGNESHSSDIRRSMLDVANGVAEMAVFATSATLPIMMISMRKAKEFPTRMLEAVCEFTGLSRDIAAIEAAAKLLGRPQVIVAVTPVRKLLAVDVVRGGIEPVHKNGAITGWAKRALSADRVQVGARVDGQEIARTDADLQRQDLLMSGVGDGHYGFILDVSKKLTHQPVRIEIFAVESGYVLGAVDMTLEKGHRVPIESAPPPSAPQVAAE